MDGVQCFEPVIQRHVCRGAQRDLVCWDGGLLWQLRFSLRHLRMHRGPQLSLRSVGAVTHGLPNSNCLCTGLHTELGPADAELHREHVPSIALIQQVHRSALSSKPDMCW